MIDERFVFVGVALGLIGSIKYFIDTLKGKTKPNRISWFFWALAPLIAFFAEIQKEVGLQIWMTFSVGFGPLLIFLASFVNKKAYWKLNKMDYLYGGISLLGLIIWQITGEGNVAIIFSILSDAFASIPTITKSYKEPESESAVIYFFSMINAIITLLTITTWDFAHYGYPIYIFLVCLIIFVLVKFKLGIKSKAQKN